MLDPINVIDDLLKILKLYDLEPIKSLFNRVRRFDISGFWFKQQQNLKFGLIFKAGVEHGYLKRPCIDPLHPECPVTAPNYIDICPVVEKFLQFNREQGNLYNLQQQSSAVAATTTKLFTTTEKPTTIVATTTATELDDTSDVELNETATNYTKPVKTLDIFGVYDDTASFSSFDDEYGTVSECEQFQAKVREILRSNKALRAKFLPEVYANPRNFGKEMTGGCSGFAQKYMQWPEDLIIGGVHREANRIVK